MTIRLGAAEASTLAGLARTQVGWDSDAAVRVRAADSAIGLFTTPPLGVLVLVALPADINEPSRAIDVTVRLDALLEQIERTEADGSAVLETGSLRSALVEMREGPSLAQLPPAAGWGRAVYGFDRDLCSEVEAATAEFEVRAATASTRICVRRSHSS